MVVSMHDGSGGWGEGYQGRGDLVKMTHRDLSGVHAIAEALCSNRALTSINLNGNDLGNEGGKAVAEALRANTALTSIDLGSTRGWGSKGRRR